jgi:hypothetical protein
VTGTLSLNAPQTISFTPPVSGGLGGTDTLTATGGASGNPVVFGVDPATTNAACTVSGANGETVHYDHVGSCVIDADQAAAAGFDAAIEVVATIPVTQESQTIAFTAPVSGAAGGSATLSAAGGASGNAVVFTVDGTTTNSACTVSGTNGATVDYAHVGSCVVDANQAGNTDFTDAAQVQGAIPVGQGSQAIAFTPPVSGTIGGSATLSATGGGSAIAVVFTVDGTTTNSACTVSGTNGTTLHYAHAGSCVVDANESGNTDFTAAAQTQSAIPIAQLTQTIAFTPPASGVLGGTATLSATGGASGNAVVFTVDAATTNAACSVSGTNGTTVVYVHAGTCAIDANQAGDADHSAAPQSTGTFVIAKATPTVEVTAAPAGGSTAGGTVTITATVTGVTGGGTPAGTVAFKADGTTIAGCASVALVSGAATCATTSLTAGSHPLAAVYAGNADYATASGSAAASYAVGKIGTATSVTSSAPTTVFGQAVSFTATVSPSVSGTVQWVVDGAAAGSPVSLSGGQATFGPIANLAVGLHDVQAQFTGSDTLSSSAGDITFVVGKAATTTAVSTNGLQLSAVVAAVTPGAGAPSGSVTFTVGSKTVGTVPVGAGGLATLADTLSGAQTVAAIYSGDGSFTGSSGATATRNPSIHATVTSAHPKSAAGWYRRAVTVKFTCVTSGAALTARCPDPVMLRQNGAAQSVTRTIHATNGGVATATVSPIDIDGTAPIVKLRGAKAGHTYATPPSVHCAARDALSGLAKPCALETKRHGHKVKVVAKATDRAGNTRTVTLSYRTG